MVSASIVGGSGYAGGELLRLLLGHPQVEVQQVTSERFAGRYVHSVHPNLRGQTRLQFSRLAQLEPCDLLFLALPHGQAARQIDHFAMLADRIIDLSADFRLRDAGAYQRWYGEVHSAPAWLSRPSTGPSMNASADASAEASGRRSGRGFVYGLPEVYREELRDARYASGVGCNATAVNLALWPLARAGLIERVVAEVKVGSSEAGNKHSLASHHPERSGAVRSFAPTGHRHQAEMHQVLGDFELHFSATAVELVRGVLCTAHCFLREDLQERDLWKLYRGTYNDEPFIRIVKDRTGVYRYPEPKILAGTNFCDIGFERDPDSNRIVVISALDNLMKGAAGSAVQSMNVMMGWGETLGLEFVGLHPV